jgi:hypothetical protein
MRRAIATLLRALWKTALFQKHAHVFSGRSFSYDRWEGAHHASGFDMTTEIRYRYE